MRASYLKDKFNFQKHQIIPFVLRYCSVFGNLYIYNDILVISVVENIRLRSERRKKRSAQRGFQEITV